MDCWIPKPTDETASLAVGTMNFGKRTAAQESERIVAHAILRGLTVFDTANAYNDGESERILGRALGNARDKCLIATKVGFARINGKPEGLSRERILAAIDGSLERLATDRVDLYYLHVPDHTTPIEESLDAIATLLDRKKILSWGVSNYASWQILEMMQLADARGMPRPVVSQQMYNLLIRQLDVEYFKFARRHKIHTCVYNPLAGGLLTGKHARGGSQKGSRFESNRLYQNRYWTDAMFGRIEELSGAAASAGLTTTELAYAWLACRDGVDSILVGPASLAHLDAAVDACNKVVPPELGARIDELYRTWQGTDATYAR
jgi:aryl-alcohol dehydrogenase-like predicted oxidoreductase